MLAFSKPLSRAFTFISSIIEIKLILGLPQAGIGLELPPFLAHPALSLSGCKGWAHESALIKYRGCVLTGALILNFKVDV